MQDYLRLPTVEAYILVDAKRCKMEIYRREGRKWEYTVLGVEDELELPGIDVHFSVVDAYKKVYFDEGDSEEDE